MSLVPLQRSHASRHDCAVGPAAGCAVRPRENRPIYERFRQLSENERRTTRIKRQHGVDIVRVNDIVFDAANNAWRRVPFKTQDSRTFFVLHKMFREIGFVDWAKVQDDQFIFRRLHTCKDSADVASKHINALLRRAGATGRNIEVGHLIRHGAKDLMIDEDVDTKAARLRMGHDPGDVHAEYGTRVELRRRQCEELADQSLPEEINWKVFEGLDFEAMASKQRKGGRPKKQD